MTKASSTINPAEAAHFGTLAAEWWDPKGSSAMLHRLNPVRLAYIREAIDLHFDCDSSQLRPLAGKKALDVGCGAGLLCEPLARMGAKVTGLDAAPENIAAARAHAEPQGLDIDYRNEAIENFGGRDHDLVTSLEVLEHVDDPQAFIDGLAKALADDGLMIISTPNRTAMSKLLLVELAEITGQIPRGTHHHDQFITPEELEKMLGNAGLQVTDSTGLSYSPAKGFALSDNLKLNYLMTVVKA
ncbi:bifunctional 2-polyprenyl-6-hydroxyphenol methylase/3-demethylubiquinol 3-O-methyltransferase UbiG [Parasphingorhabdus flavimaris]|uniref:Ubiquinone biosynthesis O-methyltransferase n=1 Tax=Parasphingorhabdus flavimaris TaxID=266812 RepID=A0ABX2N5Y6_9SPHN|nr:bifunctional 2-polyprenyl-6-hydroxyphenol methylase/3-demethylubiquinol 3-O-methyltransferase UbiG [Parasphingorhabdus flavimaris]NVD29107.1 bifunctional 2-polyprenyl-6-hydroxyphenol methylase/3-demethylubiquinol 3-O-methyltransferase UbiG [Parasphingorhabdus flavimaris]|tara:strand:- start:18471 stop:19199 length:729 start_codon:yes stop_codon:yes gene_type:complete